MSNKNNKASNPRGRGRQAVSYSDLEDQQPVTTTAVDKNQDSITIDLTDKDAWDDSELIQIWDTAKQEFLEKHLNKRPIEESDKELSWKEKKKLSDRERNYNSKNSLEASKESNNQHEVTRSSSQENINEKNSNIAKKLKLARMKGGLAENNAPNTVHVGACFTDKQHNPDAIDLSELDTVKDISHQSTQNHPNKAFKVQIDKTINIDCDNLSKNKVQGVAHESHSTGENITNKNNENGECDTTGEDNNNKNYEGAQGYYNQEGSNNTYYQQQYPQAQFNPFPSLNQGAMDDTTMNMLMAWYYAGYYTAIYQEKNSNRDDNQEDSQ